MYTIQLMVSRQMEWIRINSQIREAQRSLTAYLMWWVAALQRGETRHWNRFCVDQTWHEQKAQQRRPCEWCRRWVRQHGPPPCSRPVHQLDGVPPDRQQPRQRPHLQVRRPAGRQHSRPRVSPEPDGPVHRGHLDETWAQSWTQGWEGNAAVQLWQNGWGKKKQMFLRHLMLPFCLYFWTTWDKKNGFPHNCISFRIVDVVIWLCHFNTWVKLGQHWGPQWPLPFIKFYIFFLLLRVNCVIKQAICSLHCSLTQCSHRWLISFYQAL